MENNNVNNRELITVKVTPEVAEFLTTMVQSDYSNGNVETYLAAISDVTMHLLRLKDGDMEGEFSWVDKNLIHLSWIYREISQLKPTD